MVVVQDQAGRVGEESALEDLARLDDRAVECPAVDLRIVPQEAVARVQEEHARPLLGPVAAGPPQVLLDERRLVQEVAARERFDGEPASDLQRRLDDGSPASLMPRSRRISDPAEPGKPAKPSVGGQDATRRVERALPAQPRPEKQRRVPPPTAPPRPGAPAAPSAAPSAADPKSEHSPTGLLRHEKRP